jgi:Linalool dehydratase/isomerase
MAYLNPKHKARAGAALTMVLALAFWLPALRCFFEPTQAQAQQLARHELRVLGDATQRAADNTRMRDVNPEWDLMRRMYSALSLADLTLSDPEHRGATLLQLDVIIDALLADLQADEPYMFLLPYAQASPWKAQGRSLFVDGELALMLEARLLLGPRPGLESVALTRVAEIERSMQESPSVSGESYPNEAWTFCNTTALAALRMHDVRTGTDHSVLAKRWIAYAKQHLTDAKTGMLVSRYRYDGQVDEGPEGSSIFMVAHNLLLWDEAYARDQYERAKKALTFSVLGFGLAREWPLASNGRQGGMDVDSGPIVPLLNASPGASGLALLGAQAFGDVELSTALRRSLNLAAVPEAPRPDELSYAAAGPMGNAVVLHALTTGPLFARVRLTVRP